MESVTPPKGNGDETKAPDHFNKDPLKTNLG